MVRDSPFSFLVARFRDLFPLLLALALFYCIIAPSPLSAVISAFYLINYPPARSLSLAYPSLLYTMLPVHSSASFYITSPTQFVFFISGLTLLSVSIFFPYFVLLLALLRAVLLGLVTRIRTSLCFDVLAVCVTLATRAAHTFSICFGYSLKYVLVLVTFPTLSWVLCPTLLL